MAGEGWREPTPIDTSDGSLNALQVAIDAAGAATVVWSQNSGAGTPSHVWAQRFD